MNNSESIKDKKIFKMKSLSLSLWDIYDRFGIFLVLVFMVILLSILSPYFLTVYNLMNIVRQITFIALIGIGVTNIIITTGIDLSSGSIVGLTSVVAASFAHPGTYPVIVPVLMGLLVGTLCGALNGFVIAKGKIPPFIMTLGMFTAARGAALIFSNGRPIGDLSDSFIFLGAGKIFGIPVPILILAICAVCMHVLLNNTRVGRHIYGLGGNEQASIISGINVDRVKIFVYALAGLLASLSGVILTARISSGQPGLGVGFELDAIAGAVIGGTSLTGGMGTVFGTISGALVIGVINNGMDLLNINMYWQQLVKGFIIVIAVLIDQNKKKS